MPIGPATRKWIDGPFREWRYRPVEFARNVLGIEPHDGQQQWLLNSTSPENALTTGNQWGKSLIAAVKHIWYAAYTKGWTNEIAENARKAGQDWESMNLGPTLDQAEIVWRKAEALLKAPRAEWMVREIKYSPFPCITLFNGAKIQARSTDNDGNRLLGHTLDFINWDEAARERKFEKIRDDVLRMRLVARKGRLDYTTTGNGRNAYGVYFLSGLPGEKKDPNLYSQAAPSSQNPYLDAERLKLIASRMPDRMRQQNIEGLIVDAGAGYFSIEDLEACLSDALTRQLKVYSHDDEGNIEHAEIYAGRDPEAGELGIPWHNRFPSHRYVHFWDLADKKDFVVGWTIDSTPKPMPIVEFERFHRRGWEYNYERIRDRHRRYQVGDVGTGGHGSSKTYLDLTGIGDVVADNLKDIRAEGINFAGGRKDEILTGLQSAFSLREIEWPMIAVAYDEHKFYDRDDKKLVQDTVMAMAGAVHFSRRRRFSGAAVA